MRQFTFTSMLVGLAMISTPAIAQLTPLPDPISDPTASLTSPVVVESLIGDVTPSEECTECDAVEAVPDEFGQLAFIASSSEVDVLVTSTDGIVHDIRMYVPGNDGTDGYIDWQYDAVEETINQVGASSNVSAASGFAEFMAKGKPGSKGGIKGTKGTCGALTQAQMYILLTDGTEYSPTDYEDFIRILNEIQAAGKTIATMIIKGHGGGGGVQVGPGAWLSCVDGVIEVAPEGGNGTDIKDILIDITDGNSVISLRACHSRELAACIEAKLNNGSDVRGAHRFVIGIPGTTIGIGIYE